MPRNVALFVCAIFLVLTSIGLIRNLLSEPSLKLVTPMVYYGLSLIALLRPHKRVLTVISLACGTVFLGLGVYAIFAVTVSQAFNPLLPLLFVVTPGSLVFAALLAQLRSRARASG
jgi:hypothetical protein